MKKLLFLASSLLFVFFFSSCSKDMGALESNLFRTNPSPLEVKGGTVSATVTGTYPAKYFNKNAIVTVTPVLKFEGQEVRGAAQVFQGEKVKGNDRTIPYKTGGSFNVSTSFNYVPEMAVSELYLEFDVVQKKKTYTIPTVKVADGVISTAELLSSNAREVGPVIIPDQFQRIIEDKQDADILFLIQQSNLRSSEVKSEDVVALTKRIQEAKDAENQEVAKFEVSGYASPDGSLALNTNLAQSRQKVTVDYLNRELKRLKSAVTIDSKFTAEDWDGFQKLMEQSSIQDKEVILRILSMYTDPEQREREIKNLSVAYKSIADDILPQLRRSKLSLTVEVIGKSDAEIAALAKSSPSDLTEEELLYAGTLATSYSEKESIYQTVVNLYPNDVRGNNNLGVTKLYQGDVDGAIALFNKALANDPRNTDVNYNLGLSYLAKKDLAKAEEYFGKAAGTKGNLNAALGTLYVAQGDYSKAKSSFASTATNNAALVQILDGDYSTASRTLDAVASPDATTSYLKAIIAARTNSRDAVYTNLRQAVALDKSYAVKAAKDIEFSKFATDATFLSIIQ